MSDRKRLDDTARKFLGDRLVQGTWEDHEVRILEASSGLNDYNVAMKLRRLPSAVYNKRRQLRQGAVAAPVMTSRLSRRRDERAAVPECVDASPLSPEGDVSERSGGLIPLTDNDGATAVMGRDLHAFLEIGQDYTNWFKRMVEYGFTAGQDYLAKNSEVQDSLGRKRERHDHVMTLDMAKEVAMIQRTDKGKQARQYFIEVEKKYKAESAPQLPQDYASALRELASSVEQAAVEKARADQAETKVAELEPQATKYTRFMQAEGTYSWDAAARIIGVGKHKMLEALREQQILMSAGPRKNVPYQSEMHRFEVKTSTYLHPYTGNEHINYKVRVKPAHLDFLAKKCAHITK